MENPREHVAPVRPGRWLAGRIGCAETASPHSRCGVKADASAALKVSLAFIGCALIPATVAGEQGTAAHKEISHLLSRLGASGCQFNRNGTWHDATKAVEHINTKYEYLRKRNLVPSTEAFIERAASESSMSGKPYLVKCGSGPETPSADWLRQELRRYRENAK